MKRVEGPSDSQAIKDAGARERGGILVMFLALALVLDMSRKGKRRR